MVEMTKHSPSALPCRRADVPFKEFGPAEGMLLDLESGEYFGLEGAAVAIWKQLDGRTSVPTVSKRIAQAHGAVVEAVEKDVTAFVRQLRKSGLIAEPGAVAFSGRPAAGSGGRRVGAKSLYLPPRLARRGNLKFLGQLD